MLKTLKTLIRVQDNQLKGLQKKLSDAQQQEQMIQKRLRDFNAQLAHEAQWAQSNDFLSQSSYSDYLPHAKQQQARIESLLRDAEAVSEIAHGNLMNAYREMKKFQKIHEKKRIEQRNHLEFLEQKMLDDITQATHGRP